MLPRRAVMPIYIEIFVDQTNLGRIMESWYRKVGVVKSQIGSGHAPWNLLAFWHHLCAVQHPCNLRS